MKRLLFIVPIVVYAVVVTYLFWPVITSERGMMIMGDDIGHHHYYFRQFFIDSLKKGIVPFWNPYLFSGYPFLANPQSVNYFYPVSWIFLIFPIHKAFLYYLIIHLLLSMISMYWVMRKILHSNSQFSAWTAGIVYALSGYFVARIWAGHVDIITSSSYLPLAFGFSWFAMTTGKRKYTVIAGLIWGLQLLVGYQTIAFFTFEAIVVMGIFYVIYTKQLFPIWNLVITAFIGIGTASIQLIPSQQLILHSIRTFSLPYSWVSYGAHTYESLKQLIYPFLLGDQINYAGPPANYAEHAMYIGRLPLILILTGMLMLIFRIVWRFNRKSIKSTDEDKKLTLLFVICIAISLFGIWVSLSKNAFFDLQYILWKMLPMYKYLRIPSRHLILFVFGASILVGLSLAQMKHKIIQLFFLAVIVVELTVYGRNFISVMTIPNLIHDKELVSIIQNESDLVRLLPNFGVWVEPRGSLDFNAAMVHNIYSVTGYDPSILRSYYEFIDAINGNAQSSILQHDVQIPYINLFSPYVNFLNIKYIFVPLSVDYLGGVKSDRFDLVREDIERGYRLYKNTSYNPRFFFVSDVLVVKDRLQAVQLFREGRVDTIKTAVLTISNEDVLPSTSECGQNLKKVSVLSYTPNSIKLATDVSCSAWLVSSEVMYPGWEARIDGKKVPIREANLAFRSVFVPEGQHEVVFSYSPRIFIYGAFITLLTITGCAVYLYLTYKKKKD